ncbi:MAG: peroxiredoxin [Planctomycetia bacterium]
MPLLDVGAQAPPFTATLQDGSTFDSATLLGRKALVLFFYPKDNTPVCTREACGFRDAYEQFQAAGAEVVGVSSDSQASHLAFAAKHRLPFPIISDPDRRLRKLFGVPNPLGFLPGRVTFVIDKAGVIRLVFSALLVSDDHVKKALAVVADLAS